MTSKPKILLLHNGPKPEEVNQRHGAFDSQVAQCLEAYGIPADAVEMHVVRTFDEAFTPEWLPADTGAFRCAILSGSVYDVTMRLPWMLAMEDWIRAHYATLPMLGICFGHQIIGSALGGEVMVNPRDSEVGTLEVRLIEESIHEAQRDPLVSALPPTFPAMLIHRQSVEVLPPGAVAFFRTDVEHHQMIRFAPRVYGTQFHPEYTKEFTNDLVPYLSYGNQTELQKQRLATMVDTPDSRSIIGRFVSLFVFSNNHHQGHEVAVVA